MKKKNEIKTYQIILQTSSEKEEYKKLKGFCGEQRLKHQDEENWIGSNEKGSNSHTGMQGESA